MVVLISVRFYVCGYCCFWLSKGTAILLASSRFRAGRCSNRSLFFWYDKNENNVFFVADKKGSPSRGCGLCFDVLHALSVVDWVLRQCYLLTVRYNRNISVNNHAETFCIMESLDEGVLHDKYVPHWYSTKSTISSDNLNTIKARFSSLFCRWHASGMVCFCVSNGMLMRPERYAFASGKVCFYWKNNWIRTT